MFIYYRGFKIKIKFGVKIENYGNVTMDDKTRKRQGTRNLKESFPRQPYETDVARVNDMINSCTASKLEKTSRKTSGIFSIKSDFFSSSINGRL